MTVRRIVANLAAPDPALARAFYEDLLGLEIVMDHGWLLTFASGGKQTPQLSVASEGGSGTMVPALSIEVDDVDEVHARARSRGAEIVYGPCDEPWGVRRFYVRDPFGNVVNVLAHAPG
ncbi:glyoxalase [Pigmentiphaga sp. NML080357]|uniref:VOC family protein n=1 Tax=Pigmentiphaga sp. NML080357 TaxID=2008675 RepID=UPI000B41EC82|nr:VOC family protein [Pigmentiphaga sp. NML080357]OVZ59523.1 glyoxalase [Pigmentiphaga sp. NML080357]